jgi:hypothetical protein
LTMVLLFESVMPSSRRRLTTQSYVFLVLRLSKVN